MAGAITCKHCSATIPTGAHAAAKTTDTAPFTAGGWGKLLLLCLVTFGIYLPFWMHRRTREFNQLGTSLKIPSGLLTTYTATYVLGMTLLIVASGFSSPLALVSNICAFIIAFRMRGMLLEYDRLFRQGNEKMSGLMTFFFNFLYIEARITRMFHQK